MNPVVSFEIAATDLARATRFYETLFEIDLEAGEIDGYRMAFFPHDAEAPGASGALVVGDVYRPSREGAILYFHVADISATVSHALELGSELLFGPKEVAAGVWVAEVTDSEGNRLALLQR